MGKRSEPEEIIAKLREVEVRLSQGETIGHAVRAIGVSEQSHYRWCKEFDSLEAGKFANFIILDRDSSTVPADEIRTSTSWKPGWAVSPLILLIGLNCQNYSPYLLGNY